MKPLDQFAVCITLLPFGATVALVTATLIKLGGGAMTRRRSNPVLFAHIMGKVSRAARRKGDQKDYLRSRRELRQVEPLALR